MYLVTYFKMYKAKISKGLRVNMQCTFIVRKSKVTAITERLERILKDSKDLKIKIKFYSGTQWQPPVTLKLGV